MITKTNFTTTAKRLNTPNAKRICVISIIVLLVANFVSVSAVASSLIIRKNTEREIKLLQSDIATLEAEFLNKIAVGETSDMTMEFVKTRPQYVKRAVYVALGDTSVPSYAAD